MIAAWCVFLAFVVVVLALDLGLVRRSSREIGFREALALSIVWVALGLGFAGVVFLAYEHTVWGLGTTTDPVDGVVNDGARAMQKYLTGYVVEKTLSIDNIFVITAVFGSLAVPIVQRHRVLFWGVLGALVMRAVMIVAGARLIEEFHWILQVFAVLLVVTAVRLLMGTQGPHDPRQSLLLRWIRRLVPVVDGDHGPRFFVRVPRGAATVLAVTPLGVALMLVEGTDLIFAIDSIPVIFAITGDPFLVFTSNIFALLGLRSLYFVLAGMVDRFRYLKTSLAFVLLVVGVKMLAADEVKQVLGSHFNLVLLVMIVLIITAGIVASLLVERAIGRNGPAWGRALVRDPGA